MPKTSTKLAVSKLAVWAWVLYDFANTIFSISILTVCFPLWVDGEIGDGAWLVNLATAVSALLVFFTAPVLGAMADLRQRRVPYLVALTVISILFTAALDVAGGVAVGVALFVAADLTYQSAIVFYNALLPVVAAGRGAGKISGVPTLGSGALAGSVLTMGEAFRNALAFTGCTLPEAARMVSTTPARLVGEGRRKGRLTPGYDADVAVLAPDLSVEAVWHGGELAYEREGSNG
jgi:MFS-type transporter involved in bile tolerance (Atg22 family)